MGFLGKKPQTLLIPIYSNTVLYDTTVLYEKDVQTYALYPYIFTITTASKETTVVSTPEDIPVNIYFL